MRPRSDSEKSKLSVEWSGVNLFLEGEIVRPTQYRVRGNLPEAVAFRFLVGKRDLPCFALCDCISTQLSVQGECNK